MWGVPGERLRDVIVEFSAHEKYPAPLFQFSWRLLMHPLGWATHIALLGILGQGQAYGLAVVLARTLAVDAFETYAVVSAAFVLMVTLVLQGLDKYTLQLLPAMAERAEWGAVRVYLAFVTRRTLVASLLLGAAVAVWAWWLSGLPLAARQALLVCGLSLPAGALVHFAHEALTALGHAFTATAIFRIAVPVMALALFGLLAIGATQASAAVAVGSWGLAWGVALVLMVGVLRRAVPPVALPVLSVPGVQAWAIQARPFWFYRVALAALGQMGIIGLHALGAPSAAVGAFAAAMGTAGLALVIVTATNRVFARQLSVLLARREFDAIAALRQQRLRWLAMPIGLYLLGTLVFAPEILGFFRPEFVQQGATALRLLALAVAFMMLFALAPTYLKFRRRNRWIYQAVGLAAAAQMALLWLLVPRLGATGAALAYVVSMCGLYGGMALLAYRELRLLRQAQ